MKQITIILFLIIPNFIHSQNKIELRDLSFSVPDGFIYVVEQNEKFDYDNYYEAGKIFKDSTELDKFPKIQYQYYEMPSFGFENAKKILNDLNKVMTRDINADTLIIKEKENYSLAKYSILGKSVFEIKSLGKKGWLNIQYFGLPQNDQKNLESVKTIINSIKHYKSYKSKNQNANNTNEYSKTALIILAMGLTLFLIPKLIKKIKTLPNK